ncbi:Ig mu chain C region membrane-bound form [Scleropages formosus]|uniref:Ig mu chain C region membrane-bound form n=1 Tax=Scleropages formosus TaxID=113540 RepID=UPI003D8ACC96
MHPPHWSKTGKGKVAFLVCTVEAPEPVTVNWYRDGSPVYTMSEKSVKEGHMIINITKLEVKADNWTSGSEYKCQISKGTEIREEKTSICSAYPFVRPSIVVKKPRLQSFVNDNKDKVTAQCKVASLYPVKVFWVLDGLRKTSGEQSITDFGNRTQSITSNLTVSKKDWTGFKAVTCHAEHPCLNSTESIQLKGPQALNSTPEIRRTIPHPERNNHMELECMVKGLSPGEIYITFQANGKDISRPQFIDLSSETSVVTHFAVPTNQWKPENTFTCKVSQGYVKPLKSKPTGQIFGETSVELLILPRLKGETNDKKLVCLASGFNPQIKWYSGTTELQATANKALMAENGLVTVASEIILHSDWENWISFSCEVNDRSQTIRKNISKCAVMPLASWMAQLSLEGPNSVSSGLEGTVSVTCMAVAYDLNSSSLAWRVDGHIQEGEMLNVEHGRNIDGMQTLRNRLNVTVQDWLANKRITCVVKHPCSKQTQEKHITRGNDTQRPTVQIINLMDSGPLNSTSSSLLCLISNFFPDIISVHWELSGTKLAPSMYASSAVARQANSTYSMYSMLLVPPSDLQQDLYGCVVRHEFSEQPIAATFQRKPKENAPVVPPSPPTATLLQSSTELVCLVQGFNPAPINITWFLNHVTELLEHNTTGPSQGLDGTFTVISHLRTSISDSTPGTVYTCAVTHGTTWLRVNISKQEIIEQDIYFDGTNYHDMMEESIEEIWKATCIFLVLFIISLIYGSSITFMKVH